MRSFFCVKLVPKDKVELKKLITAAFGIPDKNGNRERDVIISMPKIDPSYELGKLPHMGKIGTAGTASVSQIYLHYH